MQADVACAKPKLGWLSDISDDTVELNVCYGVVTASLCRFGYLFSQYTE